MPGYCTYELGLAIKVLSTYESSMYFLNKYFVHQESGNISIYTWDSP